MLEARNLLCQKIQGGSGGLEVQEMSVSLSGAIAMGVFA